MAETCGACRCGTMRTTGAGYVLNFVQCRFEQTGRWFAAPTACRFSPSRFA